MKISKRSKITSSKETADRKTDRRISPTNVRYKGYMIRLDRGGDGYNVYDKHGELEDAGYTSLESAKKLVDELENESKGSYVRSSIEDHEDDLYHPDQEYDSAATSINSTKLPAISRMIKLQPGTVGVDFGGGKFDNAVEYLRDQDVTLCVYDPYNRSAEHNREVLRTLRANGGADFAINSNVLNVIKEPEARKGVLENIKKITKSGAPIYITVYEGRGDAKEGVTKSGYQLNRKTADYLEEIQEVFPDATRKGKLIVATNRVSPKHIKSSRNETLLPEKVDWYELDWDQQIQLMKKYVRQYKGSRIFEDFAEYVNIPVEDIIEDFCDAEYREYIVIPERMQLDSEYRNDDIYSSTTSSSRYWYFTRHGVQPGSVPKYVNILDIVDKPEGSYFLADGVILTKDLRDYDIKERKPEDSVTSSTRIKSNGNNQYTDADIVRSSKSIGKYFGLIYYTPDSGENGMEGDKFDCVMLPTLFLILTQQANLRTLP